MCLLVETIKVFDGNFFYLDLHLQRMNAARKAIWGVNRPVELQSVVKIPNAYRTGLYKCRILYKEQIQDIQFLPYQQRKIQRLKVLEDNQISYAFKYTDRSSLQRLYNQRGEAEDIIIIKQGFVTDSYRANLVFFDGQQWWTPCSYLLNGIQRQYLLQQGSIKECAITKTAIFKYSKVGLVNVFNNINTMPVIEINTCNIWVES
jgi:4-amino-4-deoxychorismate lyase